MRPLCGWRRAGAEARLVRQPRFLQRTGVFESGQAKESYAVIPGSGTGALHGLRGDGSSAVGHGTEHPFSLNYELD